MQDLPKLPRELKARYGLRFLHQCSSRTRNITLSWVEKPCPSLERSALWSLLEALWRAHGGSFAVLGMLKVLMLASSFAGPLLLSMTVAYLDSGAGEDRLVEGLILVLALGGSFTFSAVVNTQFNIRANILQTQIKGAMTCAVFSRALSLPMYAYTDLDLTDGKMLTIIQIDADRISGCASSLHDLWMLPIQIVVTFVLLYQQVQTAFLAGILIIVVMFPINKSITTRVMQATKGQMACKDKRVTLVSEALRGIKSVKMLGLEGAVSSLSTERRAEELEYLSQRKYLDACCVFLWASMPVLVPFSTFAVSTCLLHRELSVSEVFTTIALLNMLIFPMNAFPWVLNGCVEASVSVSRVAKVLSDKHGVVTLGETEPCGDQEDDDKDEEEEEQEKGEKEEEEQDIEEEDKESNDVDGGVENRRDGVYDQRPLLVVRAAQFAWSAVPPQPEPVKAHWCSSCCSEGRKNPRVLKAGGGENGDEESRAGETSANEQDPFSLPSFSFSASAGGIYAIFGSVASGKSTLLLGAIGEVRVVDAQDGAGVVLVLGQRVDSQQNGAAVAVAYCSQVPVLHSGSIRSNILFGAAMETARYRRVLEGCGLLKDIALQAWARGDLSSVGQGGSGLSGGQRLRVGVARALYSRAKIVLLDAPFSALDRNTAQGLLQWLNAEAASSGRTILLASHSVSLLRGCCRGVLLLQRGCAVQQGAFADMEKSSGAFRGLVGLSDRGEAETDAGTDTTGSEGAEFESGAAFDRSFKSTAGSSNREASADRAADEADPIEAMAVGRIGFAVYLQYFRSVGAGTCFLVLLFTLLMQATADGMSLWYAHWAEHASDFSSNEFLAWTGTIVAANVLCALLRSFLFAYGGLRGARRLYASLTSAILSTDLSFFERTTVGRVLNRFGKDTDVIDDQLPFMLNIVLAQAFVLLGSFVVIAISNPPILVVLAIVGMLYWRLQRFYRASSRGLRRLDATQRSPVYTELQDCLSNATTIRAMQRTGPFRLRLERALDRLLRVNISSSLAAQWLSIRLQLLGAFIATSIALLSVLGSTTGLLRVSPALLGISLVYSLSIVSKLNGLVGSLTETEQEMVSVERCSEYLSLSCEFASPVGGGTDSAALLSSAGPAVGGGGEVGIGVGDSITTPLLSSIGLDGAPEVVLPVPTLPAPLPSSWPARGEIVFRDVRMRYHPDSSDALRGVSLTIPPGSRVAVVGRSGSGKSSLLRVLLGVSPYHAGSVTIDGVELRDVPRDVLRARLSIIPQDPLLLSGPLRLSLDPWLRNGDEALARALIDCGFVDTMTSHCDGGEEAKEQCARELLDFPIVEGGASLSLGQRQLLCLGRALLRGSRVVLLDEFSSSVDAQAEALLYSLLERSVARTGSTLVVISHRSPPASCTLEVSMSQGVASLITIK